ncbi:hypothetical protein K493DRAFT_314179 [Basidiobolus meristosporus CBS 931.73]|uniref:BTB domain-containing protein n=1 Tax=Basidiobolus meristosporus CBS 931.73 TaxID=1314790 RepID=A0A1Y1YHW2_9FUNG|nr:hypothetical protein K493DRAFT_314179 [Basidiobolus meristosporus CBS 931.73]|eukprot:ORX97204.1 hypothetical protein K493DRAFT_314179 [Basidiobolus meristosporus CBS 931.73]
MLASCNILSLEQMLVKADSVSNSAFPTISYIKADMLDKASDEYIPISETEAVSRTYILENLRKMGPVLFNNPHSTKTCLHLNDDEGNVAKFWVHDFYFLHDSYVLYQLLHPSSKPNTPEIEKEQPFDISTSTSTDDEVSHIYLTVPSVAGMEHLLRWIYIRQDNEWLASMNEENFDSIMENVAFLRLSQEAYYVMAQFYENL